MPHERVTVSLPLGTTDVLRAHADAHDMSVSQLVRAALRHAGVIEAHEDGSRSRRYRVRFPGEALFVIERAEAEPIG